MTKIAKILNVAFGEKNLGAKARKHTTVSNEGTETLTVTEVTANNTVFTLDTFTETLIPKLPINSTIYLDVNNDIQNATGAFYTTDQGYDVFGTTDGSGVPTIAFGLPVISITSPLSGNFELETNQTLNWTSSNVTNVDITITGTIAGSKVYSAVAASAGTYTYQLNSADGFVVNDEFSIEVSACLGIATNTVTGLDTIATLTMTTPVLTDGVAGNITGSANCTTVNVYERLSTDVSWDDFDIGVTVIAGVYTATGTVADSGLHDFLVVDADNAAAFIQLDDVTVVSGTVVPTTGIYATHDIVHSAVREMGDLFVSEYAADEIVLLTEFTSSNRIEFRRISTSAWTQTAAITTTGPASGPYRGAGIAIDSTTCSGSIGLVTGIWNYVTYAGKLNIYDTPRRLGVFKIGNTFYYLSDNAKFYSTPDHSTMTLALDLSAHITANSDPKPCAYNSDDGYIYVLDGNKLYTFLFCDGSLVSSITMPDSSVYGLTYHDGRIHYVIYTGDLITIKVLKNSDD